MTHKTIALLSLAAFLFLPTACNPKKEYSAGEFSLDDYGPPTADMTGNWEAEWIDPVRKAKEAFVMTLEQNEGTLSGNATFKDANETKALISGQISGPRILIQMKPKPTAPYHSLPETTWTGFVTETKIEGEWFLNGKPYSGYANNGPWTASLEQK